MSRPGDAIGTPTPLVGLRGVVIKSHGGADAYAYGFALSRAFNAVEHNMLDKTSAMLAQIHH